MTSSQSYALLILCLKVCQTAGQPIHFHSLQLARTEDTGPLVNRQFKRAIFLEQMKNKNVQTKNVSRCPIMAASVTFLSTLCCAGARPQTKDLTQCNRKRGRITFSANYNIPVYLESETYWLSKKLTYSSDYVTCMQ